MSQPITPEEILSIADEIGRAGLTEESVTRVRLKHSSRRITHCFDDDVINAKPVLSLVGFNIYLVGGDEHCLRLTNDYGFATGIVLAELSDDD